MRRGGWDHRAKLPALRAFLAKHAGHLAAPPRTPPTQLVLTPVGGTGSPLTIYASEESGGYSATFPVPVHAPPGEYSVAIQTASHGAQLSELDFFESPARPRVRTIVIRATQSRNQLPIIWVDGPSGLNLSANARGEMHGDGRPIDATASLSAALAKAALEPLGAEVRFRAGVFHVAGPVKVPPNVTLRGAGSDLTAVYFAFDNISTAPPVLLGPTTPSAGWGIHDLALYVRAALKYTLHVSTHLIVN